MTELPVNGMRPIHPGEILREEYLKPLGLSSFALAKMIDVEYIDIANLVNENGSMTVPIAVRLGKLFGTAPEMWTSLWISYELHVEKEQYKHDVEVGKTRLINKLETEQL